MSIINEVIIVYLVIDCCKFYNRFHTIEYYNTTCYPPDITSQEDIFMSNIRDLAMTFYNEFVENGGDVYEPDSRFSKVMGEVDEILMSRLDFKTANDLEGKILTMSCDDVEQHYIMGFEKALEVCRIVYNRDFTAEELQKAQSK